MRHLMNVNFSNILYSAMKVSGTVQREPKLFNVLQIVKFPNDPCNTGSTNTSGHFYIHLISFI